MLNLKKWLQIKYIMVVYLGLLLLFSSLYFKDLNMFWGAVLIVIVYSIYDLLWTYIRDRVWYLPVSSWISALVLAIVGLPNQSLIFILFLPFLAVATKHLLHLGKSRHIFNPAASALAVGTIFIPIISWWGVAAARLPRVINFNNFDWAAVLFLFIVASGIKILWRQKRWHVAVPFFVSYLFFFGILSISSGTTLSQLPRVLFLALTNSVLIFFATVMLIEPLTSTFVTKKQEILYGALVGGLAVAITYLTRKFNLYSLDPLVYALLLGNLVASLWFLPGKQSTKKCVGCDCKKSTPTIADEPSYWFRDVPAQTRFPNLVGSKTFDVAIIGGGMAGVSAAYFLAKAGKKVAVVEASTIGSGDSGYTTACATRFLETLPSTLAAWDNSAAAISLFKKIIAAEKIDCGWQEIDTVCFTQKEDKKSLKDFANIVRQLQTKDAAIELLDKSQASKAVGVSVAAAYRKVNSDGLFHMRKFLVALAGRAVKNNAVFFENSEVTDVSLGANIIIKTKEGSITASKLVVATGVPSAKFFPEVAKLLRSSISYVIDVKFSGQAPLSAGFFCDDLMPYHYYRSVGQDEFLLGGEDWSSTQPQPKDNPHVTLSDWLKNLVGAEAKCKVINCWQGSIFSTPDGLPVIGSHPAYGNNVIFATGWAGNGTAQGFFGGSIAADLAMNKKNSFQKLFACDRSLVWPKNSKLNTQHQKDFDSLKEDEGKIMEVDGQKLAVVKTGGEIKTFSALCPHLGCEVGWNNGEKTWDCPCHGSRFKADGSLMKGPAKRGLDPIGTK